MRTEDRKNTHSQAKKKKIDCCGYGEQKTGKIPTAKQKRQQKIDCCGYVRTENNKNTREDNSEKKADKKENAPYCNLTYNMARFQLHIPQLFQHYTLLF